jgi:hypothetical protein
MDMIKKIIIGIILILPVFLYSCEYELEDTNFVELKKPDDTVFKVTLNAPQNEKGEYIVKYGRLKYEEIIPKDLIDYNRSFILLQKHQNGTSYYHVSDVESYLIFDRWYDSSVTYTLEYNISAPSNTGSIAELSGQEYLGEAFSWNIVFDPTPAPQLNLQYQQINNRQYRLTWERPDSDYAGEIDHYQIRVANYWYYDYYTSLEPIYDTSYLLTMPENAESGFYYVYLYAFLEGNSSYFFEESISFYHNNPNY